MADIDLQLSAATYWQMVAIHLHSIYRFGSANEYCQFEVIRCNVSANGCYQFALYSTCLREQCSQPAVLRSNVLPRVVTKSQFVCYLVLANRCYLINDMYLRTVANNLLCVSYVIVAKGAINSRLSATMYSKMVDI